jgi:integrase
VEEGLIVSNPAGDCKLPPKHHGEVKVLTHEEMHRMLVQAKAEGLFELFFLDLSTGLRRGELLGLQWDDVDFRKKNLHVRRQVNRVDGKLAVNTPKTKRSARPVPMSYLRMHPLFAFRKGYPRNLIS